MALYLCTGKMSKQLAWVTAQALGTAGETSHACPAGNGMFYLATCYIFPVGWRVAHSFLPTYLTHCQRFSSFFIKNVFLHLILNVAKERWSTFQPDRSAGTRLVEFTKLFHFVQKFVFVRSSHASTISAMWLTKIYYFCVGLFGRTSSEWMDGWL